MGGSDFDPRVTIAVGLLRWLMDYQISEIQILLESRGITISTGEISNLSREFLLHFYCIHRRHMKDMELKEYILYPRNIPSKYPFALPYFEILKRCMEIEEMYKV